MYAFYTIAHEVIGTRKESAESEKVGGTLSGT